MTAPQKFRKKPVEIEAQQLPVWDEPNWYDDDSKPMFSATHYVATCIAIAEWCGGTSQMMLTDDEPSPNVRNLYGAHMIVKTLEGEMIARPGDWIIRGVKGEFYPCKPDIFADTYEAVPA